MVLFCQTCIVDHLFRINDLYLHIDIDLLPFCRFERIDDEGISDPGLEQFKEANRASDINIFDSKGAHLQQVLFEIMIGDPLIMRPDVFEQLASDVPQGLLRELRQKKGEEESG